MELTATCPAKINLGLEIAGRRPDGYHELVTIFQAISLADTLTVAPGEGLTLACSDPDLMMDDNLCLRAADALRRATGVRRGAALRLVKRIPAAAGLGGGSSDAATTLTLLDRLWETRLPTAMLAEIAVGLGTDVPFFLGGVTALARGVGELLEPLPPPQPLWLALARPAVHLPSKTARLYRALAPEDWSDGERTLAQAARLRQGQPLAPDLLTNGFSRPLAALMPEVAAIEAVMRAAGAIAVLPAGSGPTVVAVCPDEVAARKMAVGLRAPGRVVHVARTLAAR